MENEEHFDIVDFIEAILAVDEVDKEIEEDINPTTGDRYGIYKN